MAGDQLQLAIQVQGGPEALSLLNQIDARLQSMPATAQRAGAGQQSAAQATGAAWQQAATVTAAGWDRSAAQMEARQDRASAAIAAAANRAADAQDRAAIRASQSALREFDRQITAADQLATKQAALAAQGNVVLGAGLAAGAAALTGALEQSVQEAALFQRTFTDVNIVLRPTAEGMAALQQRAIELGASTQFSSQQVAQGFYELASAGLNEREVLAAIEPAIQAATLGHQQLGQTTLTVASVMRQFGLDAADVPKIIDVQTVAVRNSLLHWGELDEAYRNVQGTARFMGISLEETTAALEIQRNAGTSAAVAGTSFRTFLDRISKGEGEAGAAIREMNLHIYDQAGAFVGITPLLQQIEAATAKMTEADRNRVIAQLAGGKASAFLRDTLVAQKDVEVDGQAVTLHGSEVLKYFADQNYAAAGAARAANAEIEKTLAFQWQTFTASIQEGAIRLGTQFVPAATAGAGAARELVNQFVNAPVATQQMAAALTVITTGTLAASAAAVTAAGAWALFGPAILAAVAASGPVLLAIGGIAAASAALSLAWINDWGNIRETTAEVATRVQTDLTGIGVVADALGTQMHAAATEVGSLFAALSQTPAGTAVGGALGGLTQQAQAQGVDWGEAFRVGVALGLGPVGNAALGLDTWLHAQAAEAQAATAEEGKRLGADFVDNLATAIVASGAAERGTFGVAAEALIAEFEARGFSPDQAREAAALYMDALVGAIEAKRGAAYDASRTTGEAFGDGMTAGAEAGLAALPDRVAAILENVKKTSKQTGETTGYDYAAGIMNALREGDAEAAQSILELERATAFYAQTLRTLTPAEAVHAEQLRLARGAQAALDQLVAEGTVSLADYQAAVMGTAKAHGTAKSELAGHDAALKKLAGSTGEATAADAKATQALDKLIESEAKHFGGAFVGYTQALIAQNRETEAAAAVEDQLGVAHGTLAAAAQGAALAQQALSDADNRAKEAALGGAEAIRDHAEALAREKEAALGGALAIRDHEEALAREKEANLGGALAIRAHEEALARDKEANLGGAVAIRDHTEALAREKEANLGGALAIQAHDEALKREHDAALGGAVAMRAHTEALEAERVANLGGVAAIADHEAGLQRLKKTAEEARTVFVDFADKMSHWAQSPSPFKVEQALDYKSALNATDQVLHTLTNSQAAEATALKNAGDATGALTVALRSAGLTSVNIAGVLNNEREATDGLTAALHRQEAAYQSVLEGQRLQQAFVPAQPGYSANGPNWFTDPVVGPYLRAHPEALNPNRPLTAREQEATHGLIGTEYAQARERAQLQELQGQAHAEQLERAPGLYRAAEEEKTRTITDYAQRRIEALGYTSAVAAEAVKGLGTTAGQASGPLALVFSNPSRLAQHGGITPWAAYEEQQSGGRAVGIPGWAPNRNAPGDPATTFTGADGAGVDSAGQATAAALTDVEQAAHAAATGEQELGAAALYSAAASARSGDRFAESVTHAAEQANASAAEMDKAIQTASRMALAATAGADLLGAQQARAYTAALVETRSLEVAQAMAQAARSVMENLNRQGNLLSEGMMALTSTVAIAKGLTYGQIYGGTQTQGGGSAGGGGGGTNQGIVNLPPGNYYGLPVVSPVTGGTLRGYAQGGVLSEDILGLGASGQRYQLHQNETVVPAGGGPGGEVHLHFNIAAGIGAGEAVSSRPFWQKVGRDHLIPVLADLGLKR